MIIKIVFSKNKRMRKGTKEKAIHIFIRMNNGKTILSSATHNYILLPAICRQSISGHCVWIYRNTNISEVWRFKYLKTLLDVNHTNFVFNMQEEKKHPIRLHSMKECHLRLEKKWSLSLNSETDMHVSVQNQMQTYFLGRKISCVLLGFLITRWSTLFLQSRCSSLTWKQRN